MLKWSLRLSWIGFVLAALVVSLGAYTRLADAGLGCPDWPGCYGFLTVPQADEHIAVAEARFPETPVEAHKGWAEMIHRYMAGTLGLVILGLAILAARQKVADYPKVMSYSLLVIVVIQALFGMWTVTLKLWPQVVTLHLLGGFTTLTLLFLLVLRLRRLQGGNQQLPALQLSPASRHLAVITLLLLIGQITLGGWTSANYAAFACPDFPTCQAQWWPQHMSFDSGLNATQHVGPNYLGGQLDGPARVAIHVSHRLGALLLSVALLTLAILLWRQQHQLLATTLVLLLGLQITLGIANVFWQFPLSLALAHNTGAALLLLAVSALISQSTTQTEVLHEKLQPCY